MRVSNVSFEEYISPVVIKPVGFVCLYFFKTLSDIRSLKNFVLV